MPLIIGLFYIAPGTGFLVGSIVGGRLSDHTVKRYIKKRNGLRLPQDRLNSGLLTLVGVLRLRHWCMAGVCRKKSEAWPYQLSAHFLAERA